MMHLNRLFWTEAWTGHSINGKLMFAMLEEHCLKRRASSFHKSPPRAEVTQHHALFLDWMVNEVI